MVADRSNTRGGVGAVEAVAEPAAKPAKPKEKRRNNEKRKEKSRDAARTRRSRECEIFTDLGEALPLAKEEVDQLDKASVMRLAIAYLKVRDMVDTVAIKSESPDQSLPEEDVKPTPDALLGNEAEQMLIKALDGFILVLSEDGDITYVSENITEILGLHQIDILSQPIWDYAHQCDHEELRHVLSQKRGPNDVDGPKTGSDLFLRLKCTLTSRGRNVNIKSASFKVIHVKGHVVMNEETNKKLFVAIGRPIPHPSNIEVPLGSQMFLTKHALDMKFTYVDEKLTALLNYQASVLMGKSLFDYHHGGDSEHLRAAFKCLLSKGQMETKQYRFLASRGGYAWIVTQATIVYDKQKPQSVVCVNYLISGIENEHEVYSLAQLEARPSLTPKEASSAATIRSGQQQTVNQGRNNKEEKKQHQQRNTFSEPQKVQKNPKSVRIVEPPQPIKTRVAPVFNQNNNTCQSVGALNTVPGNNSFSVAVNRPRSVTDALFAAAPEVVATTPAVAVASVAAAATTTVATEQQQPRRSTLQQQQLPEDMNKGFLQFAEVDPELTMLKEEVDDLSHLAPTPGDACIPLDETTSFLASYEELNDLIDNYIYGDGVTGFEAVSASADIPTGSSSSNSSSSCSSHSDSNSQHSQHQQSNQHHQQTDSYFAEPKRTAGTASQQDEMTMVHKVAPLLKDAIISENVFAAAGLDLMDSVMESAVGVVTGVEKKMDPFITYRDESSDASVATSHLLSPDDCSMQSPDGSLPSSLCSPSESYGDEDLAFMTSISMEDDMDLSMRAPYISMSEADDLPLLISEDLMWGALPTTCDAPKFVQEPKMNVVVDVAAVQVVNGGNAAGQVDKTGDFLLSSNTQNEVLQQRQQQQSNSRRRKSGGHFAADEEDQMRSAKAMPLVNLLLQPVSGEAAGALNGQQLIAVVSNGSNSCSSTEDATHSDVIEPMFEEAMTKNCSTPAADMHAWSTFSEFMVMDSTGCEGQLYSSECNSPFTSTSSMDSIGGAPQHEEKVASKKQSRKETGSHKRTLSNASASNGLGLKEMLCGGGVGGADVGVRNGVPSAMSQAKRIKCDNDQPRSTSSVVMNTLTSASPQLLQQLMAPTKSTAAKVKVVEQQQQSRKTGNDASVNNSNNSKAQEDQESKKGFAMLSKKQQQTPAPSNSVLMNLLSPLHIEAPPNILNDPLLMSALSFDSSLSSPNLLRANPLIGGDQQLTPNTSMDESMFMATSLPFLHDEASILCGRDSRPGDLKRSPSPVDDFLGSMYID